MTRSAPEVVRILTRKKKEKKRKIGDEEKDEKENGQ